LLLLYLLGTGLLLGASSAYLIEIMVCLMHGNTLFVAEPLTVVSKMGHSLVHETA